MNKYLKELSQELLTIKTEKEMTEFLKAILTEQEKEVVPKRLQIVKMLKKGVSQREIADRLGVGIATVTRGAKELKLNNFKNV
jgi:TrpR family transcriptional regulator, trp operon repressor